MEEWQVMLNTLSSLNIEIIIIIIIRLPVFNKRPLPSGSRV